MYKVVINFNLEGIQRKSDVNVQMLHDAMHFWFLKDLGQIRKNRVISLITIEKEKLYDLFLKDGF